ncbi:WhiB family transcriptional regulator [Haloechinothrix salitolerans]|uniref:Transcriptional regulator WhiB n=1 Tax=Haloechinothrix salitolerans TaxID=926830 RepID=A0ABW2BUD5_9PSEU
MSIRAIRPGGRPRSGPELTLPPAWVSEALCAQTDPEAFFPEKGGTAEPARRTCARCPVLAQCRDYALTNAEHYGVWGGLTDNDRRRIRSQGRRTGTPATELGREAA